MKKCLLIAVGLIMMSMTASAISINKVMLQHKGNVTLFDGDEMQAAIDAAADGDIIYMTLGAFNKPFTITKQISIRGVGEKTVVNGDVTVDIPESPKLTNTLMEGVRVIGTLDVKSPVDDMVISKCKIDNVHFSAVVSGVAIDRCYIVKGLTLSSNVNSITATNSKISTLKALSGALKDNTFVNCNIYSLETQYFMGTIINSLLDHAYSTGGGTTISSSVLMNCLINTGHMSISTTSVAVDCYYCSFKDWSQLMGNECISCYSDEQLKSMGYLGTDNTVIGINGGDTPFTLVSSVPTVTSSELNLDLENRKLNVKLTVSPK